MTQATTLTNQPQSLLHFGLNADITYYRIASP